MGKHLKAKKGTVTAVPFFVRGCAMISSSIVSFVNKKENTYNE